MRYCGLFVILAGLVIFSIAQNDTEGVTSEKAKKTYKQGLDYLHQRMTEAALDSFKKADKQDDGHCLACQKKMMKYGLELGDWKTAETAGEEMVAEAQGDKNLARAHYQLGIVFKQEGLDRHKEEAFSRAHEEMTRALAAAANFPDAYFVDGVILAHLKQDDAAKKQFEQFVENETGRRSGSAARIAIHRRPRFGACENGSGICHNDHRRAACFSRRTEGKSGAHRFLGYMVRTLPGGAPAHEGDCEEVRGPTAGDT